MPAPKMILFDYGQTLIREAPFDALAGHRALLAHAKSNPGGCTAGQMLKVEQEMRRAMGHTDKAFRIRWPMEVPHKVFQQFFFEYLDMELDISPEEAERVFWDAAAPGTPAEGAADMLRMIKDKGIRSAVVSNLTFSGKTLSERINRLLPHNSFEFIMASSEYVFRKPAPLLFELALKKTGLPAGQVWFCGDNFDCDVKGAYNAGMRPVWYKDAPPPEVVDFEYLHLRHWDELERYLG